MFLIVGSVEAVGVETEGTEMVATDHYAELAERYGVRLDACEVTHNPNMPDADPGASHWEVTLTHVDDDARYMTITYTMGAAYDSPPFAGDVLVTLASDARMWESGELDSFGEYCSAFGYDSDSIKAHAEYVRTRAAIETQTQDLRFVLQDQYEALLDDEDAN